MSEFVLDFFEGKNLATIEKKKHSYLMIDGHDQADIYILKDGIVKTSVILSDGREFNIMYLKGFDMLSLLKDEIKKVTSASFHIRIESDTAVFYRVNRILRGLREQGVITMVYHKILVLDVDYLKRNV